MENKLDRVPANREFADELLKLAAEHIQAASAVLELSPLSSFQLSYDAVHKTLDAILLNQGLRGTSQGGHIVLQQAMKAQLVPPLGDLLEDNS